ncbi:MAG: hypothetical protein QM764_11325 [Chitinophagaceae bacterium]
MNNVAPRRLYEEKSEIEKPLAPVITLKSVKGGKKIEKAEEQIKIPEFTQPVFRPKKHEML